MRPVRLAWLLVALASSARAEPSSPARADPAESELVALATMPASRSRDEALRALPLTDDTLLRAATAPGDAGHAARRMLAGLHTDAAREVLVAALSHEDIATRRSAAVALGRLGDRLALDALLRAATRDADEEVRARAASAIDRVGSAPSEVPDIAGLAATLAGQSDAEARARASEALGRSGDRRALAPLVEAASATDPVVRRGALLGIGLLGDLRAAAPLEAMLVRARDDGARAELLAALSALGALRSAPSVATLLAHPNAVVRARAARTLVSLAPDDLPAHLLVVLQDHSVDVRRVALDALRRAGTHLPEAEVPVLRALLADEVPFVRAEAAAVLALRSPARAAELEPLLRDRDVYVRLAAADALVTVRARGSADAVRRAARKTRDKAPRAHLLEAATTLEALPETD